MVSALLFFDDPEYEKTISAKINAISAFLVLSVPMYNYRFNFINAKIAIVFVSFKMKNYHDNKHQLKFYEIGDLVNLKVYLGYQLTTIKHPKINFQFAGFFKIIERIDRLIIYRLNFPNNI